MVLSETCTSGELQMGKKAKKASFSLIREIRTGPRGCGIHPSGLRLISILHGGFDHRIQNPPELMEARCWNNDRVPPSSHVFGNPKKATSLIFFEVKKEVLPLYRDLFTLYVLEIRLHFWLSPIVQRFPPDSSFQTTVARFFVKPCLAVQDLAFS
ncbi:hypothetical protein MPNT_40125 [Candidatus Methylacidithermus pantelleriae]|uniref:Uncharacterized protein n=1 Tax=Candidatus Methylacidithermus pantelleriae TaxID=2744239 RepID=A0A8J2FSW5_9BACT|nr:hypothetical protein MPNT_40125 [Candidatus Methylacidithermus pantelleriae]